MWAVEAWAEVGEACWERRCIAVDEGEPGDEGEAVSWAGPVGIEAFAAVCTGAWEEPVCIAAWAVEAWACIAAVGEGASGWASSWEEGEGVCTEGGWEAWAGEEACTGACWAGGSAYGEVLPCIRRVLGARRASWGGRARAKAPGWVHSWAVLFEAELAVSCIVLEVQPGEIRKSQREERWESRKSRRC